MTERRAVESIAMSPERRAALIARFAVYSARFEAQARRDGRRLEPLADSPERLGVSAGALSSRQVEVLRLVAEGLTNDEIAAQLTISIETVKSHVVGALAKLGARNRAGAVGAGFRAGLIT